MAIVVKRPTRGEVIVECEECGMHLFPMSIGVNIFVAKHPGPGDKPPVLTAIHSCINRDQIYFGNVVHE